MIALQVFRWTRRWSNTIVRHACSLVAPCLGAQLRPANTVADTNLSRPFVYSGFRIVKKRLTGAPCLDMSANRFKYFRWTGRTGWITFVYVLLVPSIVGYVGYVTEVSPSSRDGSGSFQTPPAQSDVCRWILCSVLATSQRCDDAAWTLLTNTSYAGEI